MNIQIKARVLSESEAQKASFFISELDVCIYLMSAVGIKMEVEEGASATSTELVSLRLKQRKVHQTSYSYHAHSFWYLSYLSHLTTAKMLLSI